MREKEPGISGYRQVVRLFRAASFSRYPLRSRRALVTGMVVSALWLLPAWGPLKAVAFETDNVDPMRVARVLAPLLVWLLIPRRVYREVIRSMFGQGLAPKMRWVRTLLLSCLLFSAFPLLTGIMNTSLPFVVAAVLPMVVSILALVGVCMLDDETLRAFFLGVALVALGFVCVGIATTGLTPSTYFGRPRVSFGFFHPTFSGTALLAATVFPPMALWGWSGRLKRPVRLSLAVAYTAVCVGLLHMAQSRNLFIAVIVCGGCSALAMVSGRLRRSVLFGVILMAPLVVYGFALSGGPNDPLWAYVDKLSSYRLTIFQGFLVNLMKQSQGSIFLAPNNRLYQYLASYSGFAAVESVYLSLFFNFGLLCMLFFVGAIAAVGLKLSRYRRCALPFGVLCGVVLYYALSAEGLTVSNLAVFLGFAYAVRTALRTNGLPQRAPARTQGAMQPQTAL